MRSLQALRKLSLREKRKKQMRLLPILKHQSKVCFKNQKTLKYKSLMSKKLHNQVYLVILLKIINNPHKQPLSLEE